MKLKKLFCALLSLLLILCSTLLIGCNDTPAPSEDEGQATVDYTLANIRQNANDYTIIRTEDATSIVKEAVVLLKKNIKTVTGREPEISEDWVEDKKTELEILIGQTNRPESAEAMKGLSSVRPYDIMQVGTKICIVGRDDYALRRAVYQFLSVHLGVELPESEHHNVVDFGAEGDGVHDDTDAFLAAIDAAKQDKLPVYTDEECEAIMKEVDDACANYHMPIKKIRK